MKTLRLAATLLVCVSSIAACGNASTPHCRQAYSEMTQFAQRLGRGAPPPESEFMARCTRLRPEVARCMVISYAVPHAAECGAYRDEIRAVRGQ